MGAAFDDPVEAVRRELGIAKPRRRQRRLRATSLLRLATTAALLWGLAAGAVEAQEPFVEEVIPGLSTFFVENYNKPALVDLDADGDLDAVIGGLDGRLRYFRNIGSESIPHFLEATGTANPFDGLASTSLSDPDLTDLDGDGDFDAVVGQSNGILRYLENSGSSSVPAFSEVTGGANPFDGFGVPDWSSPELVDIDGDGDLDAVVGSLSIDGFVYFFRNSGTSAAPAFVPEIGTASPIHPLNQASPPSNPELVDLDDDGDLDAVVGHNGSLSPDFFINSGSTTAAAFARWSGALSPFGGFPFNEYGYHSPALVDIDADGDLDAVVGEQGGDAFFYRNVGSDRELTFKVRSGSASPFNGIDVGLDSSPELADLDGDGDLDAVFGGQYTLPLSYLRNTGSSSAPAFSQVTGTANPFAGSGGSANTRPDLADLDGDGDLDAVVGVHSGTPRYFRNSGSSAIPAYIEATGTANPFQGLSFDVYSSPDLADLDGDGDLDAAVGGETTERSGTSATAAPSPRRPSSPRPARRTRSTASTWATRAIPS